VHRCSPRSWSPWGWKLIGDLDGGSSPSRALAQTASERPNFVVLVADHLSESMFRAARPLRRGSKTAGVEFTNAFAPTPLCPRPARRC